MIRDAPRARSPWGEVSEISFTVIGGGLFKKIVFPNIELKKKILLKIILKNNCFLKKFSKFYALNLAFWNCIFFVIGIRASLTPHQSQFFASQFWVKPNYQCFANTPSVTIFASQFWIKPNYLSFILSWFWVKPNYYFVVNTQHISSQFWVKPN